MKTAKLRRPPPRETPSWFIVARKAFHLKKKTWLNIDSSKSVQSEMAAGDKTTSLRFQIRYCRR